MTVFTRKSEHHVCDFWGWLAKPTSLCQSLLEQSLQDPVKPGYLMAPHGEPVEEEWDAQKLWLAVSSTWIKNGCKMTPVPLSLICTTTRASLHDNCLTEPRQPPVHEQMKWCYFYKLLFQVVWDAVVGDHNLHSSIAVRKTWKCRCQDPIRKATFCPSSIGTLWVLLWRPSDLPQSRSCLPTSWTTTSIKPWTLVTGTLLSQGHPWFSWPFWKTKSLCGMLENVCWMYAECC